MDLARTALIFATGLLLTPPLAAQHEHKAGDPGKLGTVEFATSCDPAVQPEFNRAMAMLHSFWYDKAREAFLGVAAKDPDCAMAHWGAAMTFFQPLWTPPAAEALQQGATAVHKAKTTWAKTPRERRYVAAVAQFYKDFDKTDHLTRTLAYEGAMEQLHAQYPDDREAAIFYALALLGTATAAPADKTLARQRKAGEIVERFFTDQPDHPGLAHYIIHSYDYPPLAHGALDAARRYAKIAPDSPHALHMPSHIFTRLGLWQESIASNLASAAAARKYNETGDELHAMDYLMYAYLQGAQDREAAKLLQSIPVMKQTGATHFAGLYATAAMPARYAIERHQWNEAAAQDLKPGTFPGGRYSWAEGATYFARAVGAARTGDVATARKAVKRLETLHKTLVQLNEKYWGEQVEVQRRAATAWLALAEGKNDDALALARSAADLEDSTEKHPVTPGMIIPARELLGDLLLELKQPEQALVEFEAVLMRAPNRFGALYGAGRAAELSGDAAAATRFYSQLVANCSQATAERAELRAAQAFMAQRAGQP